MNEIKIEQMPAFKKAYKRLPASHKLIVNNIVKIISQNPEIGDKKRGDLSSVYVYKFKIVNQQFLLAYEYSASYCLLLALGAHENFYRNLKRK